MLKVIKNTIFKTTFKQDTNPKSHTQKQICLHKNTPTFI